jgi:RNA 3'-terminal phosphate cyclase (ATP)
LCVFRWRFDMMKKPKLATTIDITTPGSITLVLQAIIPYLLFAGSTHQLAPASSTDHASSAEISEPEPITLTIVGGTNVSNSPSIDHSAHVLVPIINSFFGHKVVSLDIKQRCWSTYSRGGRSDGLGEIQLTINPLPRNASLPAFRLADRGKLERIEAHVLAPEGAREKIESEIQREVASPLFTKFIKTEDDSGKDPLIPVDITFTPTDLPMQIHVLLIAHFSSSSAGGMPIILASDNLHSGPKPRNPALTGTYVVRQAATSLSKEIATGACVDTYMRDQIVAYQCLTQGRSIVNAGTSDPLANFEGEDTEVEGARRQGSLHTKTAWWVAEKVVGTKFGDAGEGDGCDFVVGSGANVIAKPDTEDEEDIELERTDDTKRKKNKGKTGTGSGRSKFGRAPKAGKLLADAMDELYF